jgi:hypothetical protein
MIVGLLLAAIGLLVGFVAGRRLYQSRLARAQYRSRINEIDDTRKIFAGLSYDQQWLVARLVDEKNFPVADWNNCLDTVVFVERDDSSGKRRLKRDYQASLAQIVKERQPEIRKSQADDRLPHGEVQRSPAAAFV